MAGFFRNQRSGFFEEAVLLRGFVFKGPRGFGASNDLVVFNVTSAVSFTSLISFSYGNVRQGHESGGDPEPNAVSLWAWRSGAFWATPQTFFFCFFLVVPMVLRNFWTDCRGNSSAIKSAHQLVKVCPGNYGVK